MEKNFQLKYLLSASYLYERLLSIKSAGDLIKRVKNLFILLFKVISGRYGENYWKKQSASKMLYYESSIENIPDAFFHAEMGKHYHNVGFIEKAIAAFDTAINITPGLEKAHIGKARIYRDIEHFEEAIRFYNKIQDSEEYKKEVFREVGRMYVFMRKSEAAIPFLQTVLGQDNKDAKLYSLLVKAFAGNSDYPNAEKVLNEAMHAGFDESEIIDGMIEVENEIRRYELKQNLLSKMSKNEHLSHESSLTDRRILLHAIHEIKNYNYLDKSRRVKELVQRLAPEAMQNSFLQNIISNEMEIAEKAVILSTKPRSMIITLTNKCNLNCIMCYVKEIGWEMPTKTRKEIVDLLPYLESVVWLGGEVFLYDNFEELFDQAEKHYVQQGLITNGLLLNEALVRKIASYNIELTFSIEGITKEIYEKIRVGGKFEKLLENIKLVNKVRKQLNSKMRTRLNAVIMKENLHQVEDFLKFAHDYEFSTLFFNSLVPDCRNEEKDIFFGKENHEIIKKLEALTGIMKKKAALYGIVFDNRLPSTDFLKSNNKQEKTTGSSEVKSSFQELSMLCYTPWQRLYIGCDGRVLPHCLCRESLGDLQINSIEQLWNSAKMAEYRKRMAANDISAFCSPDCTGKRFPSACLKYI